jgi:hypothetical protein
VREAVSHDRAELALEAGDLCPQGASRSLLADLGGVANAGDYCATAIDR